VLEDGYKRFLALGFALIYLATFLASREAKFVVGIIAILATFIPLNLFYLNYIRTLGEKSNAAKAAQPSST
jgi:hypothetical protein